MLRRRRIQVGMFIMLGYDGERHDDLQATIEHLKRTAPDVFLTTVSYPIKGTPYYERVADRIVGAPNRGTDAPTAISIIHERPAAPLLRLRPAMDHRRSRAPPTLARTPVRARRARGVLGAARPIGDDADRGCTRL